MGRRPDPNLAPGGAIPDPIPMRTWCPSTAPLDTTDSRRESRPNPPHRGPHHHRTRDRGTIAGRRWCATCRARRSARSAGTRRPGPERQRLRAAGERKPLNIGFGERLLSVRLPSSSACWLANKARTSSYPLPIAFSLSRCRRHFRDGRQDDSAPGSAFHVQAGGFHRSRDGGKPRDQCVASRACRSPDRTGGHEPPNDGRKVGPEILSLTRMTAASALCSRVRWRHSRRAL